MDSSRIAIKKTEIWQSLVVASFILLLIPTGRYVQNNIIPELIAFLPFVIVSGIISLGLLAALVYQTVKLAKSNLKLAVGQILGFILLIALIIKHIDGIYIEFFHVLLYGGLYVAIRNAVRGKLLPAGLLSFCLAALLGLVDESLQHLHPERVGDIRDIHLNLLSILAGLILFEPNIIAFGPKKA